MLVLVLFSLAFAISACLGAGLPEDIYYRMSIPEGAACYRLLNGTHQFGCHTSKDDGRGVVVVLNTTDDAKQIASCWRDRFVDYHGGFFVMIDSSLLTGDVIHQLRISSCVRGLLLTDRHAYSMTSSSIRRSDDSQCPNQAGSFYKDGCAANAWNRRGATLAEGLRHVDWDKQMVYLFNETYIEEIEKCHSLFNVPLSPSSSPSVGFPLCAASFGQRSSAAGNSAICHRRSNPGAKMIDLNVDGGYDICHPLSGHSIVSLLPPNAYKKSPSPISPSKYMMLTARLDSFGLIPEVSPGEISVMTGLIALLTTAKGIGASYDQFEEACEKSNNYLLIALFNGEAFDYIGSSHLMYDMSLGQFPFERDEQSPTMPQKIVPSQIVSVIEAQQLSDQPLHLIADGHQMKDGKLTSLVSSLQAGAASLRVSIPPPRADNRLPPSTWHSVARHNPDAAGIVIAPFETEYTYTRLNSMSDRNEWTAAERGAAEQQIAAAAAAMLRAAADHVGLNGNQTDALTVDKQFITTLFDCLITSKIYYECDFIKTLKSLIIGTGVYTGKDTYMGVMDRNLVRHVAQALSIYATGTTSHTGNVKDEKTCKDLGKGQKLYNYLWMTDPLTNLTHCYRHSVFLDDAQSPAFLIPDYDFTNGTYSTWTESLYELDDLKLYLVEKKSFELWMLLIGLSIALASFLIVGRCEEKTFIIDEGERAAEQGEPL